MLRVVHCPLSSLANRTTAFGSFLPVVTDRRMLLTDDTLVVTIIANWKAFAGAMSKKVVVTAWALTLGSRTPRDPSRSLKNRAQPKHLRLGIHPS